MIKPMLLILITHLITINASFLERKCNTLNKDKKKKSKFFNFKLRRSSFENKQEKEFEHEHRAFSEPTRSPCPLPDYIVDDVETDHIYDEIGKHKKIKFNFGDEKHPNYKKNNLSKNKSFYGKEKCELPKNKAGEYETPLQFPSYNNNKKNLCDLNEVEYLTVLPERKCQLDQCTFKQCKNFKNNQNLENNKNPQNNNLNNQKHIYENLENLRLSDPFFLKNDFTDDKDHEKKITDMFKNIDKGLVEALKLFLKLKIDLLLNKDLYTLINMNYKNLYHVYITALIDYNLNCESKINILKLNSMIEELINFLNETLKYNKILHTFKIKIEEDKKELIKFL